MEKLQTDQLCLSGSHSISQPGLPPGIRQADCDGRGGDSAEADGLRLWNACDARQQEWVSTRFVRGYADRVRDALLDAQDASDSATARKAPGAMLGLAVWLMWIGYRDRAMGEMARRGDFSSI